MTLPHLKRILHDTWLMVRLAFRLRLDSLTKKGHR